MKRPFMLLMMGAVVAIMGCAPAARDATATAPTLVGAWRSTVQFKTGVLAGIDGLEFMYVFNLGGTMTESSNHDAAPPVPPAYGIWKLVGRNEYEVKYEFYLTKAPADLAEITSGGGWRPSGRGVLREEITVAEDGTYASVIRYQIFDAAGAMVEGGGDGVGQGRRMEF